MAFFLLELIPELIETGVELAEVADVEPFLGQGLDEIPGWIESAEEYLGDVPDLSYRAGDVAVSEEASFAEQSLATGMTVGLGIGGYSSSTSSGGGSTLGSPEIAYPGSPRSNVPSTGPIGFPKTKMSFVGLKSVRGRKTIDHPHVKKVKVSHKLKEKIQKVIDQKYCHGAITNYYGGGWMEVTSDNQQSVYGGAGDRLCESNEGWCFTVTQYLKALNGLFAGVKPCNSAASLSPYAPKDGSGVTLGVRRFLIKTFSLRCTIHGYIIGLRILLRIRCLFKCLCVLPRKRAVGLKGMEVWFIRIIPVPLLIWRRFQVLILRGLMLVMRMSLKGGIFRALMVRSHMALLFLLRLLTHLLRICLILLLRRRLL